MAKLNKDRVIEALTALSVEFDPEAGYNDLYALLLEIQKGDQVTEPVVDDKPKIKPSKHAAMCGQTTVDNHEERIRNLEAAVAYLLAQ